MPDAPAPACPYSAADLTAAFAASGLRPVRGRFAFYGRAEGDPPEGVPCGCVVAALLVAAGVPFDEALAILHGEWPTWHASRRLGVAVDVVDGLWQGWDGLPPGICASAACQTAQSAAWIAAGALHPADVGAALAIVERPAPAAGADAPASPWVIDLPAAPLVADSATRAHVVVAIAGVPHRLAFVRVRDQAIDAEGADCAAGSPAHDATLQLAWDEADRAVLAGLAELDPAAGNLETVRLPGRQGAWVAYLLPGPRGGDRPLRATGG